jgi:hypothetical protein
MLTSCNAILDSGASTGILLNGNNYRYHVPEWYTLSNLRTPFLRTTNLRTTNLRTTNLRTTNLRTTNLRTTNLRTIYLRMPFSPNEIAPNTKNVRMILWSEGFLSKHPCSECEISPKMAK